MSEDRIKEGDKSDQQKLREDPDREGADHHGEQAGDNTKGSGR